MWIRALWITCLLALSAVPGSAQDAQAVQSAQLDLLRDAVAQDPENEELRRQLAIKLHGANLREEAVVHFEWLAEHDPTRRSLLDLALAYGSVSRLEESEATYAKLLEISPNDPVALHNLANTAYKRGETDKAIELYQKAIAAKPDYLTAHAHLGDALRQAERYKEAYRSYEKVLELEPSDSTEAGIYYDALYQLAALDLQMGAYERAGMFLAELIRVNPEHDKAYYAYGQVLMMLGRVEDAQKAFEAHQRIQAKQKPTSPMAHGD
jgi:tetratricopeptide (TPR) repeat protein